MTRGTLVVWMVLDLALIGGAGYLGWERYLELTGAGTPRSADSGKIGSNAPVPIQDPAPSAAPDIGEAQSPIASDPPEAQGTETPVPKALNGGGAQAGDVKVKTTFFFSDPKAKTVQLEGDFTEWSPRAMRRLLDGRWTATLDLSPGEHSYAFIVDGRSVRDPNQKRTDGQGRSLLSVVTPS